MDVVLRSFRAVHAILILFAVFLSLISNAKGREKFIINNYSYILFLIISDAVKL